MFNLQLPFFPSRIASKLLFFLHMIHQRYTYITNPKLEIPLATLLLILFFVSKNIFPYFVYTYHTIKPFYIFSRVWALAWLGLTWRLPLNSGPLTIPLRIHAIHRKKAMKLMTTTTTMMSSLSHRLVIIMGYT